MGPVDPATERQVAVDLFNHVWRLLDVDDRTPDQDDAMVHAAHASRWHWGQVGGAEQRAVGEWQCSRVYAVLGRPGEALHHARRCLDLSAVEGVDPFVAASAHEAMARAYAVGGDVERPWPSATSPTRWPWTSRTTTTAASSSAISGTP